MRNKIIYLVNAGNDEKYSRGVIHGTSFPPLGIVSLGTSVKSFTDWDVKLFDGLVTDEQEIYQNIRENRPSVLGVSVLSTSYQNSLRLARIGKEVGAVTIFGNDQAIITGDKMLALRDEIDYVCTSDIGEESLCQFLDYLDGKMSIREVNGLMYRQSGEIKCNNFSGSAFQDRFKFLDQIPIPQRKLIDPETLKKYLKNYLDAYPDEGVTGTATINRFRGCSRVKDPCTYCGIADLRIRASSPEIFWQDVISAHETGANRLFEAGDSVSSVPSYLERLVGFKPENINWDAFVYTSARETTPRLVELYKKLGVFRANMGLDSGDNNMLKRLKGRKDSVEQNVKATKLLINAGIKIYASFVLGGPGETSESLENTVNFTKWLIDNKFVDGTEAQPLFPEINAKSGKMMLNPDYAQRCALEGNWSLQNPDFLQGMPQKWGNHENPDPEEISRDWAKIFSKVPYDVLLEKSVEIRDYSRKHGVLTGSSWIVGEIK